MRRPELTPARSRSRRAHHADATPPKAHRWIEAKGHYSSISQFVTSAISQAATVDRQRSWSEFHVIV